MHKIYRLRPFSAKAGIRLVGGDGRPVERRTSRRRLEFLVGGLIFARDFIRPIECAVRDRSMLGARLEVEPYPRGLNGSLERLPDHLVLYYSAERTESDCEVVWRDGRHLGVRFLTRARQSHRLV